VAPLSRGDFKNVMSNRHWTNKLLFISLLIFITIIVYVNSLKNDFVYDDRSLITENYLFKYHLNTKTFFSEDYFRYTQELTYRPLCTLSFVIDYLLWGLNPVGYHLQSLLWHILNVVLVYIFTSLIVQGMTSETSISNRYNFSNGNLISFFSALLFAVHPINTEAVIPITFREDPMFTTFYLVAFIVYISIKGRGGITPPNYCGRGDLAPTYYVGDSRDRSLHLKTYKYVLLLVGLVSFSLSLLSKEMAGTFIIIMVAYDLIIRKVKISREIKYYICFFFVLLVYLIIRFFLLKNPAEEYLKPPGGTYLQNVFITPFIIIRYISLLFFPIRLSAEYLFDFSQGFPVIKACLSFVALLFILFILYIIRKKETLITFAGLFFFITLLPVSNIIPTSNLMAERFLYLPSVGFCILLSYLLIVSRLVERIYVFPTKEHIIHIPPPMVSPLSREDTHPDAKASPLSRGDFVGLIILILFILFCSFLTVKRNMVWRNDFTLWNDTVKKAPDSPRAHFGLAKALEDRGELRKAIEEYQKAIALYPSYYAVYNNLGAVYTKINENEKAINCFNKAIEIKKNYAQPYGNLGHIYYLKGDLDSAEKFLQDAIKYDEYYAVTYNNLALVYFAKNDFDKALSNSLKAIELVPNNLDFRSNLSLIYKGMKNLDKAEKELQYIIQKDPHHYGAYLNLGLVYAEKGDESNAETHLKKAIEIDETNWQGYFNLGILYARKNEFEKALVELKKVDKLNPESSLIKESLSKVEKQISENKAKGKIQ